MPIALPDKKVFFLIKGNEVACFVPVNEMLAEIISFHLVGDVVNASITRGSWGRAERFRYGYNANGYNEIEARSIANVPFVLRKKMGTIAGMFHHLGVKTVREVIDFYNFVDSAKQPDLDFEVGVNEGIKAALILERENDNDGAVLNGEEY